LLDAEMNKIKEDLENETKAKEMKKAIRALNKKLGDNVVMKMGESNIKKIDSWPTGLVGLDNIIGIGGLPKGRILEIFGREGVGKTTLCYTIIAEVQRQGGTCLFIDAEHSGDPTYASKLGVNFDNLILSQPDTGEAAFEIMTSLVKTDSIDIIIVDSAAGLTPKSELEDDDVASQKRLGGPAAMLSQGLRNIAPYISKHNVTLVFTNQLRDIIGVIYGKKERTPGGRALKFWAKLRIEIRFAGAVKTKDGRLGHKVKMKTVRNNFAPPYQEWEGDLIWGKGFDKISDIIGLSEKLGIIGRKEGSNYYYFGDEKIALGYDKTVSKIKEDKVL